MEDLELLRRDDEPLRDEDEDELAPTNPESPAPANPEKSRFKASIERNSDAALFDELFRLELPPELLELLERFELLVVELPPEEKLEPVLTVCTVPYPLELPLCPEAVS